MKKHRTLTPLAQAVVEPTPVQGYVTREQLAVEYGVVPTTIRLWTRRDGLPVTRIGQQPVYNLAMVSKWFAARPDRMHGARRAR